MSLRLHQAQWLPLGNTLLALVRYGALACWLSEHFVDFVSSTLELGVLVPSLRLWFELAMRIAHELRETGWWDCALVSRPSSVGKTPDTAV